MTRRKRSEFIGDPPLTTRVYRCLPDSLTSLVTKLMVSSGTASYVQLLFNSPLRRRGWFKSFHDAPTDSDGEPIPWAPYAFIDFMSERISSSARVFEYGSGFSTAWYADRAAEVVAVEDDSDWHEKVDKMLQSNAEVLHREANEYSEAIEEFGDFDIVVIDGPYRSECVRSAIDHLSPEGVVVWDDTYSESHEEGYELLKNEEFRELFFQGMGPMTANLQRTSVFYRDENCLDI